MLGRYWYGNNILTCFGCTCRFCCRLLIVHIAGRGKFCLGLSFYAKKLKFLIGRCLCFGGRNNEVQFAGEIQPKGCCYRLEVPSGDLKVVGVWNLTYELVELFSDKFWLLFFFQTFVRSCIRIDNNTVYVLRFDFSFQKTKDWFKFSGWQKLVFCC